MARGLTMIVSYVNETNQRVKDDAFFRTIPNYSGFVNMFDQFFLKLESSGEMLTQQEARDRRVQIEQAESWEMVAYTGWQQGVEIDNTKQNRR